MSVVPTPSFLVLCPLKWELNELKKYFDAVAESNEVHVDRGRLSHYPSLGLCVGVGGLGKTQFGIQTQYFLDRLPGLKGVLLCGTAGSLVDELRHGDVLIGEKTVEHDFRAKIIPRDLPAFAAHPDLLSRAHQVSKEGLRLRFGTIASGDEDIVSAERRKGLQEVTQAMAVGWEGAGLARSAIWSQIPHLEVRGITDLADAGVSEDFMKTLAPALQKVAQFLHRFLLI